MKDMPQSPRLAPGAGPGRKAPPSHPAATASLARLGVALAWWIDAARRQARLIIAAAVIASIAAAVFAFNTLRINSGTDALLSPDLPYQRQAAALQAAFPQLYPILVIVIDAGSPERADEAAAALVERLRQDPTHFASVFYPQGDPFFRRNGLLFLPPHELTALADRLAGAQPLLAALAQDPSLRGLMQVLGLAIDGIQMGEADPAMIAAPLTAIAATIEKLPNQLTTRLSWQEMIGGAPSSAAERRRIVLAQPVLDRTSLQPAAKPLAALNELIAALKLDASNGVQVRLTGDVAIDEDELRSVKDGATTASAVCFVLVSIVAWLGLRSKRLVLATMLALVMSLVWTSAFAGLAVGHLNLISVGFGVLFIGMAVDFSIQLVMRFKEESEKGHDLAHALRQAARGSGPAVVIASVAAAIGFLSFVPTDYRGLAELGIISGGGMLIGLFATTTVIPALIALMKPRPQPRPTEELEAKRRRWLFIVEHPRRIALAALAVGLAGLASLPFVRFDIDPMNLKDPNTQSVRTFRDLIASSEASPYTINIVAADLAAAEALAARLRALPEVSRALTVSQFIPERQDETLATVDQIALFMTPVLTNTGEAAAPDAAAQRQAIDGFRDKLQALLASGKAGPAAEPAARLERLLAPYAAADSDPARLDALQTALLGSLPANLEALRHALQAQPVTLETLPADLKSRFVAADGRARVEVFASEPLTDISALQRFVGAVRAIAPEATDTPVLLIEVGRTMVQAFYHGGLYALAMILVLLFVVLRSVRDSVLVLLPLALAAVLTTTTMVALNLPFNFANIIAMPLLFSLGVAFGIYLVIRDREAPSVAALMMTSTPRAVIYSAAVTMVSFGSLMVSPHRGTASMGELLAIALSFALICTVIVLPALFAWRDEGWRWRRPPSP